MIMQLIKRILSLDSPYSWMKYLKIALAIISLIIAGAFWGNFGSMIMGGGIIGAIVGLALFLFLFTPVLLVMLGAATLAGVLIGGTLSVKKQRKSLKETAATGNAELMELEKLRIKSQLLDFLFIAAAVILVIPGSLLFSYLVICQAPGLGEAGLYIYLALVAFVLFVFWRAKAPVNVRYKNAFKEQVVVKGLQSVLGNMDFRPEEKLDESLVRASALFSHHDVYNGNDHLAADYHDHHFVQSDIHLIQKKEESYRDKDGEWQTRTILITVFRGRLMVFDYDAISDEEVAVYDRRRGKIKGTATIQTELDAFNRKFNIVAPSPIAALRILTPQVLEGIVLASDKVGHPLHLSFRENKLFVALASGDSFEAAGGDVTLSEQRRRVESDIRAMLDLVDTLYLKKEGGTNS